MAISTAYTSTMAWQSVTIILI